MPNPYETTDSGDSAVCTTPERQSESAAQEVFSCEGDPYATAMQAEQQRVQESTFSALPELTLCEDEDFTPDVSVGMDGGVPLDTGVTGQPAEQPLELPPEQICGPRQAADVNMRTEDVVQWTNQHFDELDADRDGFINNTEIETAMENQCYTGTDAQALRSLHQQRENIEELSNDELGDENDGITRADMTELGNQAALVRAGTESDSQQLVANIDAVCVDSANIINDSSHDLWGGAPNPLDNITPDAIHQGAVGDCQFLAPLSALAQTDPEAIRDMIQDNHDGTYTVTFPGDPDHPQTVPAPTDAELAEYAHGGQYGTWVSIIERAAGQRTEGDGSAHNRAQMDENEAFRLLTGRESERHYIAFQSDEDLQQHLANAPNEPITVSTRHEMPWSDGRQDDTTLPMGHEYTVTGYDPDTGMVTMRNPWGHDEPVDENGQPRDGVNDGTFTMSYEEFCRTFDWVNYPNAA